MGKVRTLLRIERHQVILLLVLLLALVYDDCSDLDAVYLSISTTCGCCLPTAPGHSDQKRPQLRDFFHSLSFVVKSRQLKSPRLTARSNP